MEKESKFVVGLRNDLRRVEQKIRDLQDAARDLKTQIAMHLCEFEPGDVIVRPLDPDDYYVVDKILPWLDSFDVVGKKIGKGGRISKRGTTLFRLYNPSKYPRHWDKVGEMENWRSGEVGEVFWKSEE